MRTRRESLVVWALRTFAASDMRANAFGGWGCGVEREGEVCCRPVENWLMSALVEAIVVWRVARSAALGVGIMLVN